MSDNLSQRAMSPANMDNDDERKKMLAGAFDSDEEDDGTQDGESVAGTSPAPSKTRVPIRGGASRFKKNTNATPAQPQHQVQNAMAPTSQPPVVNPTNNQMMGGFGNNNNVANNSGNRTGFHVEGTNIGSRASEPEWTPEQHQRISTALGTVMRTVQVNETRRRRCTLPCIVLADVLGLWEEVEEVALVELGLPDLATLEKLLAPRVESTVQDSEEDGDFF